MRRTVSLSLALVALAAAPAAAQLAQTYADWAAGPARHLFTKQDREAWQAIATDAAAEDFVRLFWARRDPTPESAENEFRREFERRVAYADQEFGEKVDGEPVRGSLTDRGRALILLGPPRRVQAPGAGGSTTGGDFGSGGADVTGGGDSPALGGAGPIGSRGGAADRFGVASTEVWVYEGENRPAVIEKARLRVTFRTKPGTEEVELFQGEEALGAMGAAIERAVVNPDLTLADVAPGGGSEPAAAEAGGFGLYGADPLDDPGALEALRSSLEAETGAAASPAALHLDAGAFQASDGTWIVPVQVATEGPAPPADAVVVGELVDAAGESKVAFRLEPGWKESRDQRYAKATVVAPPGAYRLRAALESAGGEVLWAGEREVEVPAAGGFWVSEVVLSEDIHPMPHAQEMLEPWAWMGIAVVPEGDRTFRQGSVLWTYLHACRPGLDEAGKPRLRATVTLTGPASFRGPAVAEPVKAGDHCWVLASAYDLLADRFPPGDYTVEVAVRDAVTGTTLQTAPVGFTVAPGG
jgi:GWxTD domain-containing protein